MVTCGRNVSCAVELLLSDCGGYTYVIRDYEKHFLTRTHMVDCLPDSDQAEPSHPDSTSNGTTDPAGKKGGEGGGRGGARSGSAPGGKRGRSRRERGMVLLTALEQEMVEWAMKGFLPTGPDGLRPTPGDSMRDMCTRRHRGRGLFSCHRWQQDMKLYFMCGCRNSK